MIFKMIYLFVDVSLEAEVAKGRRDFAFTERDKVLDR